jgi:CRISPR/Cas system-associated exonuclease Cas4 (RecB family)
MRYWLSLASLAIALALSSSGVRADTYEAAQVTNSSTITVDAVPLHAEVRLDGVPIGRAEDLVARAIAVTPGHHVVTFDAPGYITATVRLSATLDWATRIWLQLVPERR